MKINDIIVETIDQAEASKVHNALVSSGDNLIARFFQQTRQNPMYTNIASALRAAEQAADDEEKRISAKRSSATKKSASAPDTTPNANKSIDMPKDYGDRFYGNQYTGSLGRSARLGDVDLGIDFDQTGLKTIGKTIGAAKAVAKPFSNLAKAFKAGMNKAPSKR